MSNYEEALQTGKKYIETLIVSESNPEPNRIDVTIHTPDLKQAVSQLIDNGWGYLITITGLDHPPVYDEAGNQTAGGQIEALYHFAHEAAILSLRVQVDYADPKIDSICGIIPSATIYEREIIELFGVELVGTPDTSRLVLPDEWPENVYPLRKSFTGLEQEKAGQKEAENG